MSKIIEFGSVQNPEYPRSLSDAIILRNVGMLKDGTDMNGKTLTALINKLFVDTDTIKFLHCSDLHGNINAITQASALMGEDGDLRCCIVTGDITPTSEMLTRMQLSGKFLTLLGNHDVSNQQRTNYAAVAEMVTPVCQGVSYGDPINGAGYYYKDFSTARGRVLRYIAFDEYEHSALGEANTGIPAYTQAQIEWFIGILKATPSDYSIVIGIHQPLGEQLAEDMDNLFTAETYDGITRIGGDTAHLIPDIMDAYLSRDTLEKTYRCGSGNTTMDINSDFTKCAPAKFLFYAGGHMHCDALGHLYTHTDQLQVLVDKGGTSDSYSDLTGADADYCLNKYTVNMETGDILIERIGRQQTQGGQTRDRIEIKGNVIQ